MVEKVEDAQFEDGVWAQRLPGASVWAEALANDTTLVSLGGFESRPMDYQDLLGQSHCNRDLYTDA